MADYATFRGSGGSDGRTTIKREIAALTTVTLGDCLYAGQMFRTQIRKRTFAGVDVNGAPFTPYSVRGPYYFYPNAGAAGSVRGALAPSDVGTLAEVQHARRTSAKNRYSKVKGPGVKRTPFGIRFQSYAAAKAAHGVSGVNLYGMEQHPHMLDTMMVRAGGAELSMGADELLGLESEFAAAEQLQPCQSLTVGFYGPEAERAKGNNEGAYRLPRREFFALNQEDLTVVAERIRERMEIRARSQRG